MESHGQCESTSILSLEKQVRRNCWILSEQEINHRSQMGNCSSSCRKVTMEGQGSEKKVEISYLVRSKTGRPEHYSSELSSRSPLPPTPFLAPFREYFSYTFPFATSRYFPHLLTNSAAQQPGLWLCCGHPSSPACRVGVAELGSLEN